MIEKSTHENLEQRIKELEKEAAILRQKERQLRDNNEKYQQLLENLNEVLYTLDLDAKVTYITPNIEKIAGYLPEEIIGRTFTDFIHPGDMQNRLANFRKILSGESLVTEYRYITKNRESVWIMTNARPIYEKGGVIGIQGILVDITERKQAEDALRESEERFRILSEAAFEGILIHEKGKILDANQSLADMFGYSLDEVIGMHILEFTPPAWREKVKNMRAESVAPYEAVGLRKDGSTFPSELRARKTNYRGRSVMITAVRDLTSQKQAEERLRKSEQSFRELFNSITDLIYTQDLEGRFLSANPALENLFGYGSGEILGRKASDFMKPELRPLFESEYLKNIRENGYHEGISSYFAKDGKKIFIEYRSKLVQPDHGAPYISGIGRDVTERVLAGKERKHLESQLLQAQKMESIGTLAGGIAHNFNNVLMGIQGRTSLMLVDKCTAHPDFDHLKGIEEYVRNATDLTKDLLGFARGGKYEVKPIDLNEIIKRENEMFGRTKKDIKVQGKYDRNLWTVKADQGQIRQVLMNLYVNAWQAMPGGGQIYVQTENVTISKNYARHFEINPGRYVKISVTDTGVGMDEETRQRIFDPFFTTHEKGHGTGLGLASVYGIVNNHGGLINVYSEKGRGTTFNIYLPASEEKIEEEQDTDQEDSKLIYGQGTVLIVDDEEMIIDVGNKMLKILGYTVLTAGSGKEAVHVYTNNKGEIDLVILDMIMPGMGGGETFDKLKEIDPQVKVLLASGYSLTGEAKNILSRGCKGFIQKPFSLKGLSQKVSEIISPKKGAHVIQIS